MSEFKADIERMFSVLKAIEERARNLKNQNLADIIAAAHGRVKQIGDHPDLEMVEERKDQRPEPTTRDEAIEHMRLDGASDPVLAARDRWPHFFQSQPAPFPQQPPHQTQGEQRF